ncbi:hypothetical protein IQ63_38040 [Streptomyces acidiscabies]|uniref:Uncharacterized protein n=1 Tax=Streptomyces acidiscabies TaxID=42234 RepID=A0A0L0JKT1_9ACTN|nr:hypothetical protein IQ63_38040 [Streptomyces acidiscabies]
MAERPHLMPPLGAGANLAMLEGAELAESLMTDDLDAAVRAFELRMWERAAKWAHITTTGLERLVSPDPMEAIAHFDRVQPS